MIKTHDFGPIVWCTEFETTAYSHRPSAREPYFCGNCGSTDHKAA